MTIGSNRFFHDPQLAQAASNLSALFAPPSGADAHGWAAANAKREEASRMAKLFDYQNDPNFDPTQFDRMGVGAGAWAPNQSYYSVDQGEQTLRRGQDIVAGTSRANNAADNARAIETTRMGNTKDITTSMLAPVAAGATRFVPKSIADLYDTDPTQVGTLSAAPGETVLAPNGTTLTGAPKPLSETEWIAQQNQRLLNAGTLTDQNLVDAVMGKETPVKVDGPNGPVYSSPGAAVREGASAYEKPTADKLDNFLAIGPDGTEKRFVGYSGPDGQIYDVATRQPVPNIVRKESTGGGMSFETDGQGGIKLSTGNAAGNTTARTTDLQRAETDAGRAVVELTNLYETLRPDDLGAAGNINEVLTDYGAQAFPSLARPDVAGTRAQLRATTLGLARALVGDERLSDQDRRAANDVMASDGLGESLPGAKAKLASLIALSAYRKKYANTVRTGGAPLPPLDGAMLGRLVDEKAISPRVAQDYARNVLDRGTQSPAGILPGVNVEQDIGALQGAPAAPPAGNVDALVEQYRSR